MMSKTQTFVFDNFMHLLMHLLLSLIMITAPVIALGQQAGIAFGAGKESAPANVNASDGIYDQFVLIRWEASEEGNAFRLFRATSPSGASMLELTKNWQNSTWFCDYSAEIGRDYYYAVMATDGNKSTPLSRFDKGFLRKPAKMAQEESLSVETDKYAAGKSIFVLVSDVQIPQETYQPGAGGPVTIGLQNIFEETTPPTEIRVYLSRDVIWDFSDVLLATKSYSGFPAAFKGNLEIEFVLPEKTIPGNYQLLIVASSEGNILHAKTGAAPIKISGR